MSYSSISFIKAFEKLYKDVKNKQYSYITTKTWLKTFGCVIGFDININTLSVFKVDYVDSTLVYSNNNYCVNITDMNVPWYYFPNKEALMKFCNKEFQSMLSS